MLWRPRDLPRSLDSLGSVGAHFIRRSQKREIPRLKPFSHSSIRSASVFASRQKMGRRGRNPWPRRSKYRPLGRNPFIGTPNSFRNKPHSKKRENRPTGSALNICTLQQPEKPFDIFGLTTEQIDTCQN